MASGDSRDVLQNNDMDSIMETPGGDSQRSNDIARSRRTIPDDDLPLNAGLGKSDYL